MKTRFNRSILYIAGTLAVLLLLVPANLRAQPTGKVLTTGLNGPMGVLVADDSSVWVIDTGLGGDSEMQFPHPMTGAMTTVTYGNTARVVRVDSEGGQSVIATLPSVYLDPSEAFGGSRLAMLDGALYATSGLWQIDAGEEPIPGMSSVVKIVDGTAQDVVNTFALENATNPDGYLVESNPFGLVAGLDGQLWMTDAAGNTLVRVDPETGAITQVALFEGLPSPLPNPHREDRMETDPVPTGIAFGADGRTYVSLLSGFPFVPGSAKVVTVGAGGEVADYATGMTMLVDLQTGPDGEMYAVSFGVFTEQGPQPNSGSILRIKPGDASATLVRELSFPTSIGFNAAGDAYVTTNGVGAPGSGEVMVFAGLASGN